MQWWTKQLLKSKSAKIRLKAIRRIRQEFDRSALDVVASCLLDPDEGVALESASALGEFKDQSSIPPLLQALQDPRAEIRKTSITALKRINSPEVIQPISKLLNDSDALVRGRAAYSLNATPHDSSADCLVAVCNDLVFISLDA